MLTGGYFWPCASPSFSCFARALLYRARPANPLVLQASSLFQDPSLPRLSPPSFFSLALPFSPFATTESLEQASRLDVHNMMLEPRRTFFPRWIKCAFSFIPLLFSCSVSLVFCLFRWRHCFLIAPSSLQFNHFKCEAMCKAMQDG